MSDFDAIVLAGGRARRLGGIAKPQLDVGGTTLLDRVLAAVFAAERVVVVGPRQPTAVVVAWAREDPPRGGPVAALAAALPLLTSPVVVTLAADLPWIAPAVTRLLDGLGAADAEIARAVLVDETGLENHLAAAWRREALNTSLHALPTTAGVSMRTLADGVNTLCVADTGRWGRDCDTWDDVEHARAQLR